FPRKWLYSQRHAAAVRVRSRPHPGPLDPRPPRHEGRDPRAGGAPGHRPARRLAELDDRPDDRGDGGRRPGAGGGGLGHPARARAQGGAASGRRGGARGARGGGGALGAAGVPLAVWTTNARRVTESALERCGLRPFFETLVTRDEAALKPDPAGLTLLRRAHPAVPVCMIGDSWVDGLAAQAGGAAFIAYRIGPEEIARRALSPRVVIHDLRALPAHP